jgi:hypothetical protein
MLDGSITSAEVFNNIAMQNTMTTKLEAFYGHVPELDPESDTDPMPEASTIERKRNRRVGQWYQE